MHLIGELHLGLLVLYLKFHQIDKGCMSCRVVGPRYQHPQTVNIVPTFAVKVLQRGKKRNISGTRLVSYALSNIGHPCMYWCVNENQSTVFWHVMFQGDA